MARGDGSTKAQGKVEEVDLETLRAVQAYGSGVRTTLRHNATAYGFSVAITSAFGLVSSTHAQAGFALQVMLFAAGAGAAVGLAQIPGTAAWPATAFGTTLVYLLVGGLDVLIARQMAHRARTE
jgi:hypothetical protein